MAIGKCCSVAEFVAFAQRQVDVVRASSADPSTPVLGPMYLLLVGSGFSLSAGMPSTYLLALAIYLWDQHRQSGEVKAWPTVFDEAARTIRRERWTNSRPLEPLPDELTTAPVIDGIVDYYQLMHTILDSIGSRHRFITSAIQWSNEYGQSINQDGSVSPGQVVNTESILLASMLMASTPGSAMQESLGLRSGALAQSFARCCCTTNFDEVIPAAFHLCNQPVDIVDSSGPRSISESPEYPTVIYLHGRHLNYDLRNTPEEVADAGVAAGQSNYDPLAHFRQMLRGKLGLLVIGYGGSEADGLILRFIREALEQKDGLQGGLWWHCFDGPSSISPQAQAIIQQHERAHFVTCIQPAGAADLEHDSQGALGSDRFMPALVEGLGLDPGAAVMHWFAKGNKIRAQVSGSLKLLISAVRDFCNQASSTFGNYSRAGLESLLEVWRSRIRDEVQLIKETDPSVCGDAISWAADLMVHCDQASEALSSYDEALELHIQAGCLRGQGNDHKGRADALFSLDRPKDALEAYDQALLLHTESNNLRGQGNDHGGRGEALLSLNRAEESLAAYDQALLSHRQDGGLIGQGNAHEGRGDAFLSLKRPEEALQAYRDAYGCHFSAGTRLGLGNSLSGMGDALLKMKRADEARESYEAALEHHLNAGDPLGLGHDHKGKGDALLQLGQADEARGAYVRAIEQFVTANCPLGQGNALEGKGDALLMLDQEEEAAWAYDEALEVAGGMAWKAVKARRLSKRGWCYLLMGLTTGAHNYLKEAQALDTDPYTRLTTLSIH